MERRCYTIKEAAYYLSISPKTLMRHSEIAPIKIGHLRRYDKVVLDAYLNSLREAPVEGLVR